MRFFSRTKQLKSYGLYWRPIGDGGCSFWQPVQADLQPKSSGLVLGRRPLGAIIHSSNEPDELSQWLWHDNSTINIVLVIIIIKRLTLL